MALDLALRAKSAIGIPARDAAGIHQSLELLAPAFRERVELLLQRMRAAGHDPKVQETYRTPARAAMLAARGTGTAKSMHCYGCAVDIICARLGWKAGYAFWRDLRDFAEQLGLVSGARFKSRHDAPHVQCVEVTKQWKVRALFDAGGQSAVNAWVADHLEPLQAQAA